MSNGSVTLQCQYYDGRQPLGVAATILFTGQEATVIGEQLALRLAARELRVSPRIGRADRFIALPDGGQLQCPDHPLLDRLPHDSQGEGLVAWLEARAAMAVAGIAVIVTLLVSGYYYGLPAAANYAADHVPIATEQALGSEVLTWLDNNSWFKPTAVDAEMRGFIQQDFDELRAGLPFEDHYRLEFRDSFVGANAFALPGGTIVITDDLVNEAETLDEVAAVLAHEIGHVERRHTLRAVLQDSATAVVVATLTGDAASLTVAVAGLPTLLARTKYSREFESEADEFAFDLLKRHGRSPEAFATMMERLAGGDVDEGDDSESDFAFLSTHPVTAERVRRAREAAGQPAE